MPKRHIKLFLLIIVISVILALFTDYIIEEKIKEAFIKTVPTILSALLAGLIASLTIIFSLSGGTELKYIFKKDYFSIRKIGNDPDNIDNHKYVKFLEALKRDSIYVFVSLIISVIAILLYKISVDLNLYEKVKLQINLSLTLSFFAVITSIGSMYDVISSLFTLNKIKYAIQKDILLEEINEEINNKNSNR